MDLYKLEGNQKNSMKQITLMTLSYDEKIQQKRCVSLQKVDSMKFHSRSMPQNTLVSREVY